MHDTALIAGELFAVSYGGTNKIVVDIGGQDINGSLRSSFESKNMKYICVDMVQHSSVDIVVNMGEKLPFDNQSVDIVISTSCFEHDPCFWLTFKEMSRIVKMGGYVYINAPSNGPYHQHPGDNWRFYYDAGQSLSYWSSKQLGNEEVFPLKVIETFHLLPLNDQWIDYVCIWERVEELQTEIITSYEIYNKKGKLEELLLLNKLKIKKKN